MNRKHFVAGGAALLVLMASTSYALADGVGPVTAITNWLNAQIKSLWLDVTDFVSDFLVSLVDTVLAMFEALVYAIPSPDFLTDFTVCMMLNAAGPWTAFIVGQLHIGEALGVLGVALVFRLLRVFLTLFQWT